MLIEYENKCILKKVISGGQTGADQAGLFAAKACGFETGGFAPLGYRTLAGNNPIMLRDEFHLVETIQRNYQVRTALNVKNADATIRLASNFYTPGELCTLKAINRYEKPYFDVNLKDLAKNIGDEEYIEQRVQDTLRFLIGNQVITLNIAGNADRHSYDGFGFHFQHAVDFLTKVFSKIKNDS